MINQKLLILFIPQPSLNREQIGTKADAQYQAAVELLSKNLVAGKGVFCEDGLGVEEV
ncbi:hypothetical protein [Dolichospermum sp. UHCC 0259]|uniref:hypothetical protein n=1 Tax=Dolichospermum sp. UHCC 0259 TaxID=2590010 RepID=UPI00144517DD|nr:hypothetical protein [Dolichospermum sp. UHCC 0259]